MTNFEELLKQVTGKAIDVTLTIKETMITYPGDPKPTFQQHHVSYSGDKTVTITIITLTSHAGTHVDYPSHLFPDLATSSDFSFQTLIGETIILDVSDLRQSITKHDLTQRWQDRWDDVIVILKTGKGKDLEKGILAGTYPVLTREAALFLVNQHIKAVGIDTLSIDPLNSNDLTLHETFLKAGIPIIEGLNLELVEEGTGWMMCLPLKIDAVDGAPARVILFPLEEDKK